MTAHPTLSKGTPALLPCSSNPANLLGLCFEEGAVREGGSVVRGQGAVSAEHQLKGLVLWLPHVIPSCWLVLPAPRVTSPSGL